MTDLPMQRREAAVTPDVATIIMSGYLAHDGSRTDDVLRVLRQGMEATAGESGLLAYRFTADLVDPRRIHIFEVWEDEASLDAHQRSEQASRFLEEIGGLGITEAHMIRYSVRDSRVEF